MVGKVEKIFVPVKVLPIKQALNPTHEVKMAG